MAVRRPTTRKLVEILKRGGQTLVRALPHPGEHRPDLIRAGLDKKRQRQATQRRK